MLRIYLLIQMFKNLINSSLNLDKFSAQNWIVLSKDFLVMDMYNSKIKIAFNNV